MTNLQKDFSQHNISGVPEDGAEDHSHTIRHRLDEPEQNEKHHNSRRLTLGLGE